MITTNREQLVGRKDILQVAAEWTVCDGLEVSRKE